MCCKKFLNIRKLTNSMRNINPIIPKSLNQLADFILNLLNRVCDKHQINIRKRRKFTSAETSGRYKSKIILLAVCKLVNLFFDKQAKLHACFQSILFYKILLKEIFS